LIGQTPSDCLIRPTYSLPDITSASTLKRIQSTWRWR